MLVRAMGGGGRGAFVCWCLYVGVSRGGGGGVVQVTVVSPVRPTLVRECLSAAVGGWGGGLWWGHYFPIIPTLVRGDTRTVGGGENCIGLSTCYVDTGICLRTCQGGGGVCVPCGTD